MTNTLLTVRNLPGADAVLLIHGLASDGRSDWETTGVVQALADAGRGAIVVDLPGHGDGPSLHRGQATTSDIAAALADAIADAGLEVADVIAYSLGARLAWTLAGSGLVRRLVLGGLSPMDPFGEIDVDALEAAAGGAVPADPMIGMLAQILRAPGVDAASVVGLIDALHAEPFDAGVDAPTCPTLFISGSDDQMSQGVEALVTAVPGSTLERVPGDHLGALASPEFRAAAVRFVTTDR
ncbi:alpha/beta hydrolase [Microbacterium protaetiae]|uniref:Alpha/beta hydrolase n=1 Tax=Microbacterium protaetiae TaxID=2509458 RepID=A0A4P6EFJ5_9MICO|nr:alpha/beta fold hydrolase [Microbacterium protaetiae]QAY58877.1 alpha/beta hydrolase [Microbacterium protaetiae]